MCNFQEFCNQLIITGLGVLLKIQTNVFITRAWRYVCYTELEKKSSPNRIKLPVGIWWTYKTRCRHLGSKLQARVCRPKPAWFRMWDDAAWSVAGEFLGLWKSSREGRAGTPCRPVHVPTGRTESQTQSTLCCCTSENLQTTPSGFQNISILQRLMGQRAAPSAGKRSQLLYCFSAWWRECSNCALLSQEHKPKYEGKNPEVQKINVSFQSNRHWW